MATKKKVTSKKAAPTKGRKVAGAQVKSKAAASPKKAAKKAAGAKKAAASKRSKAPKAPQDDLGPFDPNAGVDFEAELYTRQLALNLSRTLAVGDVLIKEAPKNLRTDAIAHAHGVLVDELDRARKAWGHRLALLNLDPKSPKLVDDAADSYWQALDLRLEAYEKLPADRFPLVAVAARLRQSFIGKDSLKFLNVHYTEQLGHMTARLETIQNPEERKALESVVGADFVAAVHEIMPAYQTMVQGLLKAEAAEKKDVDLSAVLKKLSHTIVQYAKKWVAWAESESTVRAFELVAENLAPIANAREARPPKKPKNKPEE